MEDSNLSSSTHLISTRPWSLFWAWLPLVLARYRPSRTRQHGPWRRLGRRKRGQVVRAPQPPTHPAHAVARATRGAMVGHSQRLLPLAPPSNGDQIIGVNERRSPRTPCVISLGVPESDVGGCGNCAAPLCASNC